MNSLFSASLSELLETVVSGKADCRFRAHGFSMTPFIKDNDILTVSPLSSRAAGLGKIAAFSRPGSNRLVVHRIVGRHSGRYLVKGDGRAEADGLVPVEHILGIVTGAEREGRKISLGLGPERFLIAFLSRNNLWPVLFWFWNLIPLGVRRSIKCRIRL